MASSSYDAIRVTETTDPRNIARCGACGREWDDSVSTDITPAPAARCPWEYEHPDEDDERPESLVITIDGRLTEPGEVALALRKLSEAILMADSLEAVSYVPMRDSQGNTIGGVELS